ncbi:glycosyltransferase family 9 protein, partial [Caminibacter sp.]
MKVLIIKLASLGDVLATSPLFSLLTEKGYEVDHMVDKDCALVTANNPFVKNQIIVDTSNTFAFLKVISKLFLLKKYDVIFCFHRSDILGLIARMLGKKVYGFENRTSFLYTDSIKYEYKNINRTIQEYNLVLKYDHSIAKPKQLEYYPKESELKKFNLPDKYIVCNPGGGVNKHSEMKSRRWVSEYFNEVIENLPYKVILVGAGDSDELIAKSITSKNAINLINKTTFDETALILKKSLFYFGN